MQSAFSHPIFIEAHKCSADSFREIKLLFSTENCGGFFTVYFCLKNKNLAQTFQHFFPHLKHLSVTVHFRCYSALSNDKIQDPHLLHTTATQIHQNSTYFSFFITRFHIKFTNHNQQHKNSLPNVTLNNETRLQHRQDPEISKLAPCWAVRLWAHGGCGTDHL